MGLLWRVPAGVGVRPAGNAAAGVGWGGGEESWGGSSCHSDTCVAGCVCMLAGYLTRYRTCARSVRWYRDPWAVPYAASGV